MRVLCIGCLVRLAQSVRCIQDALERRIFTELQAASESGQDEASPVEPSMRYEERRVYRNDRRAVGASAAAGFRGRPSRVRGS